MRLLSHRRRARGSILLTTVVVLMVLTLLAVGAIRRANVEMENVAAKTHYDQAVSCAEGARALIMSQFRATGMNPASLVVNEVIGGRRYATGHYDQFGVATVTPVVGGAYGGASAFDSSNRTLQSTLGGTVYRVTVVCADTQGGRQSEVEFLIRFGL